MKVCVSAPDSKLANLAILRIAQFHINKSDFVKWYEPLFDQDADVLYISKIFTFTDELEYHIDGTVFRGGTGYDVYSKLSDEIEAITEIGEAYTLLYPEIDYSIMFTTRGCVRKCSFCVVPKKEGLIHNVPITSLNPNGTYIELLDNNFFSKGDWRERLDYLKSLNQPINFNTGIDVRTLTEEQAIALGNIKLKALHIAFDSIKEESQVIKGIEILTKHVSPSKVSCYVLVGFETHEIVESDIYRVMKLHSYKITPFAMGFIDFDNPKHEKSRSVRDFARWVNRHIFKKVRFEDYLKNIEVIE